MPGVNESIANLNDAIEALERKVGTDNSPDVDSLDYRINNSAPSTYAAYINLARDPESIISGAIMRDANEAATSAAVVWPDGSPGTFTATTVSTAFPGAVDAYTVTYGSPVTRTYTQPAVTRDAAGAVTNRPMMVVT